MTTFEITIIVLLEAIVVLLIVLLGTAIKGFHGMWKNQDEMYRQQNIIKDDLMRVRERVMHLTIIDDKLDKIIFPTTQFQPCYAPDNIRKWDCINCPKRSTCGSCTAPANTIKVKGKRCELTDEELMKRLNEDNKED